MRLYVSLVLGAFVISFRGPPVDALPGPLAGDPWKWLAALALVAIVLGVERKGLGSLLLRRPSKKDLEWVLYAFGIVMTWSWVMSLLAPQDDNDGIDTITSLGILGVSALIVTAAVTEEVIYRGFLAERLGTALRSRLIGAALSVVVFAIPHVVFFGPSWLLHQLPGTLALAAIALCRRNLPAAMLLHLLINLPILIPTTLMVIKTGHG
ncbi:CPBP family intramembrane glutamic endopeptidase [Paractinoplanes lichenicola]|uniref:CPBP family intramembrane metalloprotease n=1 Tax=Paractinoplanes lichenicola TaxID=2802976 RepID=A0ABS1VRV3_9ACTN|nr:CPBP family intramembrane glutamic endopeptidase [Actinoplanes lichenicola]MBL7257453.1 CPBP family intramembrane metalloprotease [Actinoplanes lichenicola]